MIKNKVESNIEIAMKTGADAVGADSRRFGELEGRTERSYCGEIDKAVQLTDAAPFVRAHDPSTPMNTLGPSTPLVEPD